MGGEGMSEGMRGYIFFQIDFLGQLFDQGKDHGPAQPFAPAAQKNYIAVFPIYWKVWPNLLDVDFDVFYVMLANGDKSLFVALAGDPDEPLVKKKVGKLEVHQ